MKTDEMPDVKKFAQKIADGLGTDIAGALIVMQKFGKDLDVLKKRQLFIAELRSGKYKKGCIQSDEKGKPIIKSEIDNDGHCACAIMGELFGQTKTGKISLPKASKALGLTAKACGFIQKEINDTPDDFNRIADRIESLVFKDEGAGMHAVRSINGEKLTKAERLSIRQSIEKFKNDNPGKKIII